MVNKLKSRFQLLFVLTAAAAASIFIGHGCGGRFEVTSGLNSASSMCVGTKAGTITAEPNTQTTSIAYGRQVLDNMVACTGIGAPSLQTEAEWESRNASLSEYGLATDVTAPMMMAFAAVGGEVCNDLINQESALAADQRRIFGDINFGDPATALSRAQVAAAVRMLARSCWQRNETTAELDLVIQTTDEISREPATSSRTAALGLCTAMLASLSAIQM